MVLLLDVGVDIGVHRWVGLVMQRHIWSRGHSCNHSRIIDRRSMAVEWLGVWLVVQHRDHHVGVAGVTVQWLLHQRAGELQALFLGRRGLRRVVVGGVDHPQHPHLTGVGAGDARVVVELVVDGPVLTFLDALLVLFLRVQVGHQAVRTLVTLGVGHPLSLAGVLDGGPERARPLTLEVHRLGLGRVDDNLALLRVVEHILDVLDELALAGERLDDLVLDVPALENSILSRPSGFKVPCQLLLDLVGVLQLTGMLSRVAHLGMSNMSMMLLWRLLQLLLLLLDNRIRTVVGMFVSQHSSIRGQDRSSSGGCGIQVIMSGGSSSTFVRSRRSQHPVCMASCTGVV